MNKKIVFALLTGAAVIAICWIRRSNVLSNRARKKDDEPLRGTPYPYEYTL